MKTVYDIIRKQNGRGFANAVHSFDNGIFDIPGIAETVKYAGRRAEPLLPYLDSLKDVKIKQAKSTQSPFELLDRAGYIAEYADTHEKHVSISHYYKSGERICFFNQPDRPKIYHIINAVKKNANLLRREHFPNPKRQDEYGTSVISIHILKSGGFICITNRYNHSVENPDNTFDSNPDNIIFGLSAALKSHFNVDFSSQRISPPNGYVLMQKQIIKYNHEINGVYYCDGFYVRDGKIHTLDPDCHIMMDYFFFDSQARVFAPIDGRISDGFSRALATEINGEKPSIGKNSTGNRCVKIGDRVIVETSGGQIVSARLEKPDGVGDNFLHRNKAMTELCLPRMENPIFAENILADNGLMVGKLYYDYAMRLRESFGKLKRR